MNNTAMQQLGEVLTRDPAPVIRLYELPDEFEAIEAELMENGGELTPEIEARIDALELALDQKAGRICRMIRNHDASARAYDEEIDRLKAHKQTHEITVKRLKDYLHTTMNRLERIEIAAGIFKVVLQNNSRPAIRWTGDVNDIPEPFKRVRVELDGDAAYNVVKGGGTLPDGFEVVRGQHVRIR